MNRTFDRFADWVGAWTASPYFFAICAAGVFGWICGLPVAGPLNDTYHLLLNSPTTAITFLLVAVAANEQHRFERSTNARLCAILEAMETPDPVSDDGQKVDEEEA